MLPWNKVVAYFEGILHMYLMKFGILLMTAGAALAQAPAFEVATIKPAQPPNPAQFSTGKIHIGMKIEAGRVDIGFMSLADLIRTAYAVKPYQVTGPDIINSDRFDILAKMPEGATKEQVPAMLKQLLADRFKLTAHTESKQHSVYALIVGKAGPKLKDAPPDPVAPAEAGQPAGKGGMVLDAGEQGPVRINQNSDGKGATVSDAKGGTTKMSMGADGNMHMEMSKVDMPGFADMLSRFVDRPVIDKTDLKGKYQVALDLSMQDMMRVARASGMMVPGGPGGPAPAGASAADAASDPGSGGSVFTAVQALGLKLDPRKEAIDTVVVDHIEKTPTDN